MITWPIRQLASWHVRRMRDSMTDPRRAQGEAFARLRRELAGSDVAVRSGFDACATLEECRRLPPSDSAGLKATLDDVYARGAAAGHVFGRGTLVGFARTSGTEGEPKHVPITAAWLASLDRTIARMVFCHLFTSGEWANALRGKRVLLGSRPFVGESPTGLPVCDASGLIATRAWRVARWLYAPRHRDHWIADWPTKAERILDQTLGKDVRAISGIPALVADLARRARERYGVTHLDEVWPNLRQIVYGAMHLSAEQRAELSRGWFRADHRLDFFETYFSTEAPLAFALEPNDEGLALLSLENLYLFRAYDGDDAFHFADELTEGRLYSIHVTTPGGLVNYRMGDRVEVLSRNPLRIRVAGREVDELSITGEKITLPQIDLALDSAGLGPARLGNHLPVVWIEREPRPRLVWVLPSSAEVGAAPDLAARLDAALCGLNVLYAEARIHENVVAESRVVLAPAAVFEKYRDARLGLGQFKPVRMFTSSAEFAALYGWTPETPSSPGVAGSGGS